MSYYIKLAALLLGGAFAGMLAAAIGGYLVGAIGGFVLTFYNNTLSEAPNMAYLPTAYLIGSIGAKLAILPGAAGGSLMGIIKIMLREK